MARFKMVNGTVTPLTAEEEIRRNAEEAEWEAGAVDRAVRVNINGLETTPRRVRESLIALGTTDQFIIDEDAAIVTERAKL